METAVTVITLGLKIRRGRERKQWTQQELADAVGVHRVTVASWEGDAQQPRNRIGALEEILGIDLTSVPA
jgi:transcriptional regulator with XRE-family HTH domain